MPFTLSNSILKIGPAAILTLTSLNTTISIPLRNFSGAGKFRANKVGGCKTMRSKCSPPTLALAKTARGSYQKVLALARNGLSHVALCASVALLLAAQPVMANVITWSGGGANASWGNTTNWDSNNVPTAVDTATISGGGSQQPKINNDDTFNVSQTNISAGSLTIFGLGSGVGLISPVTVSGTGLLDIKIGGSVIGNVTTTGGTVNNNGTITGIVNNGGQSFSNFGTIMGNVINSGHMNILTGGLVQGNVTNNSLLSNAGSIDGSVTNFSTYRAGDNGSVGHFINEGLLDLGGNTLNSLSMNLDFATSVLSIDMDNSLETALFAFFDVVLGGTLRIDFTGVSFTSDSVAFDLITAGGFGLGDFSEFEVIGLGSEFSFSTAKRNITSEEFAYTGMVERNVNAVPEPATWLLVLVCLVSMGRIRSFSQRN